MHNLISFNQLAAWKQLEPTVNEFIDQHELMNDYFNCMIDCDDNQQTCKRVCRELLST